MKILVGGGAGYIGSLLVPALISKGHEVDVIDLCWFGNKLPKGVNLANRDLLDCTEKDLAGYDQFIFLAGISSDPMAEHSPSKNFILNGALPSYLAFLAKQAKVKRFVYASTCSVYGYTAGQASTEEDPAGSRYPYGISKLQGEKGALQLQDDSFSVIALRQGTVCGYSPRMRMDLVVNAMFKTSLMEGKIIINNPEIWRPVYDIRDCVEGFIRAVEAEASINGVFNVASENYTVETIAHKVKEVIEPITGKSVELVVKHFQDFRSYNVSIKKAQKYLGFKPKYGVEEIVKDLLAHRKELGDLEQDDYYNIRVFKQIVQKEELHRQRLSEMEKFKY
jgi:nucleoside-diphosphate-sugar epimerase